jgi:hypothetical protein
LQTSSFGLLLSPDGDRTADSTCDDAEPVGGAALDAAILAETCWVLCAAC